jgi:hypothetical protein
MRKLPAGLLGPHGRSVPPGHLRHPEGYTPHPTLPWKSPGRLPRLDAKCQAASRRGRNTCGPAGQLGPGSLRLRSLTALNPMGLPPSPRRLQPWPVTSSAFLPRAQSLCTWQFLGLGISCTFLTLNFSAHLSAQSPSRHHVSVTSVFLHTAHHFIIFIIIAIVAPVLFFSTPLTKVCNDFTLLSAPLR